MIKKNININYQYLTKPIKLQVKLNKLITQIDWQTQMQTLDMIDLLFTEPEKDIPTSMTIDQEIEVYALMDCELLD